MCEQEQLPVCSLRKKLLIFLLIAFLPAFGLLVARGIKRRNEDIQKAQKNAFLLTQSLAAQQDEMVTATRTMLAMLAGTREVQTLDAAGCNRRFSEFQKRYPHYALIAIVAPDGNVFAASSPFTPGTNLADRKFMKDALRTRDFSAGEYIVGRISKRVTLNYGYPVFDRKGRLIAVIEAAYSLDSYKSFVSKLNLPDGYSVLITDWKGVRLFRWPQNEKTAVGEPMIPAAFQFVSGAQEQGFHEWMARDGVRRIYAFQQIRLRNDLTPYLYILVGIPKKEILQNADLQALGSLSFMGICTAGAMFLAWRFGNTFLLKPIDRLTSATRQFGAGRMDVRMGPPYTSDELGSLAKSFDEMASLLEKRNAERKNAEEALNRANAELESRVNERTAELTASTQRLSLHRRLSPLATIEWNLRRNVVDWNNAAEQIFGYTRDEVIGREGIQLLVPQHAQEQVRLAWAELLASNGSIRSTNENITKDGRTILCEWYNTTLVSPSGEIVGIASVAQDVTEAQHLQEQLLQSQKMEAIGKLAGGVAHDFNNLLMVISSYSELLLNEMAGERQHHYAEQVLRASRRAADLTSQLLAFSRKQVIAPQILNVNTLVRDLDKMLPRLIREDIDLQLRLAEDLRQCKADPTHLQQVIMNLVVNARDAMPDGGLLLLETANVELDSCYASRHTPVAPGNYVMLAVSDSGIGISADQQARIFEPFFTTKGLGKGTGLGLSTVYGVVRQNGGYIFVYSEPGHGSTFKVYLPSVDDAEAVPRDETPQTTPRGCATVLFVEDEAALREAGAEFLKTYGYHVLAASNGEEAMRSSREFRGCIDALITDVVMPGFSGTELAERITSARPNVRVLYMSGYSEKALFYDACHRSAANYLQKPFSFRVLGKKLAELLRDN